MSALEPQNGAYEPALVRVQRDSRDRDDKLAAGILELWDLLVRVLDLSEGESPTDPEAIAALRAQLAATGRREWAEGHAKRMAESHQAARRQSGTPSIDRRYDGTRAEPLDDERDRVFAAQRLLGAESQAARHQKMAQAGGWIGDASDAHMATRKERAEIYKKLQAEGRS